MAEASRGARDSGKCRKGRFLGWESETATDAEVRVMEMKLIRETDANDPAIGYNLTPRETG